MKIGITVARVDSRTIPTFNIPTENKGMSAMKTKNTNYEKDKTTVLNWMHKCCLTHKNARNMDDIRPHVEWALLSRVKDVRRYLRKIMSELKHAGHTCSSNDRGYWAKPLSLHTYPRIDQILELEAEKESAQEDFSRAMKLLAGCRGEIERCDDLIASITHQPNLPLGA